MSLLRSFLSLKLSVRVQARLVCVHHLIIAIAQDEVHRFFEIRHEPQKEIEEEGLLVLWGLGVLVLGVCR